MSHKTLMVLVACCWLLISTTSGAVEPTPAKPAPAAPTTATNEQTAAGKEPEKLVSTQHSMRLRGQELRYTATAGFLRVTEESSKQAADVFFVAYVKDGVPNAATRALTFAFNGGPGAASVWLHMGILGPKRVVLAQPGQPSPPPYTLADNEYGLLDLTDLVFIDPVGTGFSRAAPGKDQEKPQEAYYGVIEDVKAVGEFIRLYTNQFHRWNSPKFLVGESYGTVRAVLVADHLLDRFGMNLNGLMLISAVLDFQTLRFQHGNDLPYATFLPTYALTAAYHHKTAVAEGQEPARMASEVDRWALESYLPALAKGDDLTSEERQAMLDRLTTLTGLSRDYLDRNNLRVTHADFVQELLRGERQTLGVFDSRFTVPGVSESPFSEDPNLINTATAYVAAFNDYLVNGLKFEDQRVYEYLSSAVNRKWNWKRDGHGFLNVTDDLASVIRKTRQLKVFIASGYYDLAACWAGTRYAIRHLGLEPGLRGNVSEKLYEAGHQMYTDTKVLPALRNDLEAFIRDVLKGNAP